MHHTRTVVDYHSHTNRNHSNVNIDQGLYNTDSISLSNYIIFFVLTVKAIIWIPHSPVHMNLKRYCGVFCLAVRIHTLRIRFVCGINFGSRCIGDRYLLCWFLFFSLSPSFVLSFDYHVKIVCFSTYQDIRWLCSKSSIALF